MSSESDITALNDRYNALSAEKIIEDIAKTWGTKVALASSLGAEDQVLTYLMIKANPKARIFVLDTGRLHQETYDVMPLTMARYHFNYDVYFPESEAVEQMVRQKGPNLFFESVDHRKTCCGIRKVEPLNRALKCGEGWITGLRREQAVTRQNLPVVEWDPDHEMIKFNPLASWTTEQVWEFIKTSDIPYNRLHDLGFPSIGCAPCTRAIKPGEDLRAGRWWWENPEGRECGLHVKGAA